MGDIRKGACIYRRIGGTGARWVLLVRCIGKMGWLYREDCEACRFGLYIDI